MSEADLPDGGSPVGTFTGRRRRRTTSPRVLVIDRLSRHLITVGGIGTILSVLGVALFLVWVALPLFLPAEVDELRGLDVAREGVRHLGVDEYQVLGWVLLPTGEAEVFRLDTGEVRARVPLVEEGRLSASAFLLRERTAALGLTDGTVRLVDVGFESEILDAEDLPADAVAELAAEGDVASYAEGVLQRTPTGQFRYQRLTVEEGPSARVAGGPIHRLDLVIRTDGPLVAALGEGFPPPDGPEETVETTEDVVEPTPVAESLEAGPQEGEPTASGVGPDRLVLVAFEETTNFLTGRKTMEVREPVEVPLGRRSTLRSRASRGPQRPEALTLSGPGVDLYVAWSDGELRRFGVRDLDQVALRESGRLWDDTAELAFFRPILGGNTFLVGDSAGRVRAGFPVRLADAEAGLPELVDVERSADATMGFALTKNLVDADVPAVSMAPSSRSRLALAGFLDGRIRLWNVTHASLLGSFRLPTDEPPLHLVMSPKEDGLLVATAQDVFHARLDPGYAEAGVSAFFRPVWYEGYAAPEHIWQSSSGTDEFEMKLGLMPLIFGTLKATFYSMLFGAPLALLAALFTSEFLHSRVKSVLKPSIELMASLPSVVLGFLAALVFAPYIEKVVPATLSVFFTLPFVLLLGAFLWQLLPGSLAIRLERWRFGLILALIPVGVWLAGVVGPWVEELVFSGDVKRWLAWDPGREGGERFASPFGGWLLLTLPLSGFLVAWGFGRWLTPQMRRRSAEWDRRQYALADLARFAFGVVLALAVASVAAWTAGALGFDPRGSFVDTYVQRNALVVGFVMGFAIIPIIYTISEDALSTVPEHLRSASLGAGATKWQTATRIIIPTAMSGLFSAMMIGLGRAVGETMIVLMAAGNTPVMEWNIFEGFRTLSANIAVELPEAVNGSTHYRTLFLAALVLFAMTFVVNTVAEVVRQRFRRRAYQL